MLRRLSLVAFALSTLAPLVAHAQGRPIGLAERKGGRQHAIELELDASHSTLEGAIDRSFTTLLPKLYGSFGLTDTLELEVTLPTVFLDYTPESGAGDSELLLANPFVGLFYANRGPRSLARIGAGVALPLLDAGATPLQATAPVMALATRGMQDVFLYYPEAFSVVVPAQLQVRSTMLVLGLEGALAIMLNASSSEDEDDVEVGLQGGALVGLAMNDLTLGLKLQVASIPTARGDNTQVSALPFLQADFPGGGFVHGGLLVNLDEPFGVFGDTGFEVWSLRIGAGSRF